ncbi:hypothetical protein EYR41_010153 [Orbilia oligospora]|uniref:Uncharacterized protein n=1 Tax=Orbilia oligospora TaxID=2813651 RepID=A0A7C8K812_ORBOL|nr:hypothetical protein TWF751_008550 [Orbilia oligospora]TGJ64076.1 hypothetical protein EYR41_010153 [Orbilia oligospora]
MLFSTIYAFALLALSTVVLGGKEHCVLNQPACLWLAPGASSYCLSLITKSGISRTPCTSPTSTTVQTTTTRYTNTKVTTTIIPTTRTIWVTKPTVGVITRTSVVTRISTRVFSSATWRRTTRTVTATVSTTTRLPSQTCLARRALDVRQAPGGFPESCSCFLTTTRQTGVYTILLTSILSPNATTTSISTSRRTLTTTSTRVTTTRTVQTLLLRTTVRTTSITVWRTSTTTIASTRTVRQTFAAACTAPLTINAQPATANIVNAAPVKVKDFKDCCNRCFASNGCNSYEYRNTSKDCILRYSRNSAGCRTPNCPLGRQIFNRGSAASGKVWGTGPCYGGLRT